MMRILVLILLSLWFAFAGLNAKTDSINVIGVITPTEDESSLTGWYIPTDMDECIEELDKLLPDDFKDSIRVLNFDDAYNKIGHLNQWMLNSWKIWDSSAIVRYFNKYGIIEPTQISGAIIKVYWRYLNDLPKKLELNPKYYSIGNNLNIKVEDKFYRYPGNPAIWGKIIYTGTNSEFTLYGKKFTLLDSLYDPIIKLLFENGFSPSERLLYIWWPQVATFGAINEKEPIFLNEDELEENYNQEYEYTADYILVIDADNPGELEQFIRNFQYDDSFFEKVYYIRNISFHLIKRREVIDFD